MRVHFRNTAGHIFRDVFCYVFCRRFCIADRLNYAIAEFFGIGFPVVYIFIVGEFLQYVVWEMGANFKWR